VREKVKRSLVSNVIAADNTSCRNKEGRVTNHDGISGRNAIILLLAQLTSLLIRHSIRKRITKLFLFLCRNVLLIVSIRRIKCLHVTFRAKLTKLSMLLKKRVLLLTRHVLIQGDLNARNQGNAFSMGGDLNARNPT